jgi:hypothetical protein
MREAAAALLVMTAIAGAVLPAAASCLPSDITAISYAGTSLPPYSPFTPFSPKLVTVTVSATRACAVEVAFLAASVPAKLSGAGSLNYDVQQSSATTSLLYTGTFPVATAHIDIGAGLVGSASVQVSIAAGQVVGDGAYSDASLLTQVFDKTGAIFTLLKSANLPLTGSVARACQIANATTPTLNFTPAIANGLPRAGYQQSIAFTNVNCTAPSTVRLSGNPMLPGQSGTPGAVFDNFIHYRASASLSGANVTLDTSTATDVISAARNVAVGAMADGTLRLDVALVPGKPLLSGTYSSVLTISIDPNP